MSGVEREAGAGARQLRLALPLTVRELQCTDHRGMGYIIDDNGLELAYGDMALSMEQNRDIAAEIVRAVNAHADLLAALSQILADLPSRRDWLDPALERAARAAIARATGVSA